MFRGLEVPLLGGLFYQAVDEPVERFLEVGQLVGPPQPVSHWPSFLGDSGPLARRRLNCRDEGPELLILLPLLEGFVKCFDHGPVDPSPPVLLEFELMAAYCFDAVRYEDCHDDPEHADDDVVETIFEMSLLSVGPAVLKALSPSVDREKENALGCEVVARN